MAEPFRLTMYEPPTPRGAVYQWRFIGMEGQSEHWQPCSPRELAGMLEQWSRYPDQDRAEIDAGATIVRHGYILRRRPDRAAQADAARQACLF